MHDYAGISSSVGLTANPIVNFSAALGNNNVAVGSDVAFDTKEGAFTKYNVGASFTNADLIASVTLYVVNFCCYSYKNLYAYVLII